MAGFASTLQKQPAFLKNSKNTSSSMMKNEKPRLSESQANGRDRGTSLDPSEMTTLMLTKNKERMQVFCLICIHVCQKLILFGFQVYYDLEGW